MPVVAVANPKGGVGKSTLSTQIAGYFASRGHAVMLGDDHLAKPPKGTTHVVLDTPAGLHGKRLKEVLKLAHKVVVPLQPSVFDIFATRAFLDELADTAHAAKTQIGIVGMRVDERTRAADQLRTFVDSLGLPVLGFVRDTQNYIQLPARRLTIFDVAPGRIERDLTQWAPICSWLDSH